VQKLQRKNVQNQNSSKCARNVQQQTTGDSAYSTLTSAAFRRSKRGLPQVSRRRRQLPMAISMSCWIVVSWLDD
jgi:hypothetical protein